MTPDKEGVLRPAKSIEDILKLVPDINKHAEVDFIELENKDSVNVNPTHWTKLVNKLASVSDTYDGVIITHGTYTMSYSASAVSLALGAGNKIPIVFTGSQLPLLNFGTDARFNLENSVKTVVRAAKLGISEVMIVFSDVVLRGNRSLKVSESKFAAFDSPVIGPIARVTSFNVEFSPFCIKRDDKKVLDVKPHFQRGILCVDLVPGQEPSLLLEVLRSGKCQGLLLKSPGVGVVPTEDEYSIIPVIKEAVALKIPVLVATKFVGGRTNMEIYETGKLALDAGAIPTGDMTDVMAQVKFMWALAEGYHDRDKLASLINQNLVGEITT